MNANRSILATQQNLASSQQVSKIKDPGQMRFKRPVLSSESGPSPVPGRTKKGGPSKDTALVLALTEVADNQQGMVGGKAANLAVLMRAQLPVPPGFCITAAAFGQFLDFCPKRKELSRI